MKWSSLLLVFIVYSFVSLVSSVSTSNRSPIASFTAPLKNKSLKQNRLFARNSASSAASVTSNNEPTQAVNTILAQMTTEQKTGGVQIPQALKLLIGAGGIYASFLYYGTLQEDVFHYKAADGTMFKQAWFLQALGKRCSMRFIIITTDLIANLILLSPQRLSLM